MVLYDYIEISEWKAEFSHRRVCIFCVNCSQQHYGTVCPHQMETLAAVLQLMDLFCTSVEEEGLGLQRLVPVSMALLGNKSAHAVHMWCVFVCVCVYVCVCVCVVISFTEDTAENLRNWLCQSTAYLDLNFPGSQHGTWIPK